MKVLSVIVHMRLIQFCILNGPPQGTSTVQSVLRIRTTLSWIVMHDDQYGWPIYFLCLKPDLLKSCFGSVPGHFRVLKADVIFLCSSFASLFVSSLTIVDKIVISQVQAQHLSFLGTDMCFLCYIYIWLKNFHTQKNRVILDNEITLILDSFTI